MGWILFISLLFLPCIEIWIFLNLTALMSLSTIFLQCIVTIVAGVWLIQGENISLWTLVESELLNQRIPTEEILDDLLLWIGGIFLIVPGLLTDGIGIAIFIPIIRLESIKWLRKLMRKSFESSPMS